MKLNLLGKSRITYEVPVDIAFKTKDLRKICSEERQMNKKLGRPCAKKLRSRIADLQAALTVWDIKRGRPHELHGDLAGSIAVELCGGKRMVVEPNEQPAPLRDDGGTDWKQVTGIRVTFVGDYHA